MKWQVPPWIKWSISVAIPAGFMLWIESEYGWRNILAAWRTFDLKDGGIALGLVGLGYLLRTARIYYHFQPMTGHKFMGCLRVVLWHNCFNNFLPMRSGEITFPLLMQKHLALSARDSIPALLWFRFLDFLFLLALWGLAMGWTTDQPALTAAGALIALALMGVVLLLRQRLLLWLEPKPGRLFDVLRQMVAGIPGQPDLLMHSTLWTVLTWSAKLMAFSWILMKMAAAPWAVALLGAIAGELSTIFPIHAVAGAGTYEAAVVAVFFVTGISAPAAWQAAINLHLFVLAFSVFSVLFAFIPVRTSTQTAETYGR